jgi:transcription elongation factor Elf1
MTTTCPFCEHDPYHYVDNGVGMEAVAVNCCELGITLFGRPEPIEKIEIWWDEFIEIANKLRSKTEEIQNMKDFLVEHDLWEKFFALTSG